MAAGDANKIENLKRMDLFDFYDYMTLKEKQIKEQNKKMNK